MRAAAVFLIASFLCLPALGAPEPYRALMDEGQWKEAYDLLRPQLVSRQATGRDQVDKRLGDARECLQALNRLSEFDALLVEALETHTGRWRAVAAAAWHYQHIDHSGYLIAGEFRRGQHRGGGRAVSAAERDRVRSLQLYRQALKMLGRREPTHRADLYSQMAGLLGGNALRMQQLTDLQTLPDYEDGWYGRHGANGAPVDENDNPIVFNTPASWKAAANDGERWRWALREMVRLAPSRQREAQQVHADFLLSQFGVQTLAHFGRGWGGSDEGQESGIYTLHTLAEDETLARLATGVKRFKFPEGHNPIALYQDLLAKTQGGKEAGHADTARKLASLFENRRQYDRAAEYWRIVEQHGSRSQKRQATRQLAQIEKPWGQFGTVTTQQASRGATVEFRFRNGEQVELTAQRIHVEQLINDVRAYLESRPKKLAWNQLQIEDLGYRMVNGDGKKYVGEQVVEWSQELDPPEGHFDRRVTLSTPLQQPGAYLITAKLAGGNTSKIVLWVADTAIVRKPLDGKLMYYVADARSGKPVADAQVEFFGWRQERGDKPNDYRVTTARFAQKTNADGITLLEVDEKNREYQWLATAKTDDGRLAFFGFRHVWRPTLQRQKYDVSKAVVLTDRPVYRPGQTVPFKAWIARARYDHEDDQPSEFAHKTFQVEVYNAKNEKVDTRNLTANSYGGIQGEYTPSESDQLGVYRIVVSGYGEGTFRVEEYRKPEFEVTVDAPAEGVKLGEAFTATINARYYFGSPVTNARVKYKVVRTERSASWFPPMPWDWLYGPSYWWPCGNDQWYPGWERWGCRLPTPVWWWQPTPPPEVVAEGEAAIGESGTLEVTIDTALAKELHSDTDHDYRITAEVTDRSRRTITGVGSVLAARKTIQTVAWLDGGYYRVGDTMTVRVANRRPDGTPIAAKGVLRLLQVTYPASEVASGERPEPKETEVRRWDLASDATGAAELQFKASEPGRYRISYAATDEKTEDTAESGCLFTIIGEGFDDGEFEFDDVELVLDKQQYQPGDTAQVRLNVNRRGGVVLLFVRPSSSVYPAPQVVRLDGKSTTVPIEITRGDMPNCFVEAVTVHGGKVHHAVREIIIPPDRRVVDVEVLPSAEAYQPGQEAKVKLRVTDADGAPVVGDTVVSIYDKSLDYIAGGTNAPDLREHFWKWRRSHRPHNDHSLLRHSGNLIPRGQETLRPVGVFGWQVVDDLTKAKRATGRNEFSSRSRGVAGGMMPGRMGIVPAASAPMSAMADGFAENEFTAAEGAQPVGEGASLVEPTVRSEFADTALWVGSVETDADGLAEVSLTMPENLTAWRVRVWSMSSGARVGQGDAEVVTRKDLIVRLQTPRFLVDTDEVVLSANVHNYLEEEKQCEVRLELEGNCLEASVDLKKNVTVPPGGEVRVDWRVKAVREGEALVTALALTDEESDAMQLKLPVHVHGAERVESFTGVIGKAGRMGAFEIVVPAKRWVEQTRLDVRYSPTLVGSMVEALPYLIEYPHGCTEQTLNRFLPAVLTQRTLERMGVELSKGEEGSEKSEKEKKRADDLSRQRNGNPVFSHDELDKIVHVGVRRLQDMQLSDGGWGWFSGYGEHSSAHTTAVVVRGLLVAEKNDVAILDGVISRGVDWLENYQAKQIELLRIGKERKRGDKRPYKTHADNTDTLVYSVLAESDRSDARMERFLIRDRLRLAKYSLAMLGHGLHLNGRNRDRDQVIRNLKQFVVTDKENQTAYLNLPGGYWWNWYGSEFEAQAYFLKLLSATEPNSDLTAGVVKYLVNNRRHGTYWNSTRDTALVIEAMADYLAASGEAAADMTIEVWIDGEKRQETTVASADALQFDGRFTLTGGALEPGRHTVELRKKGDGRLYYNASLTNFTLEDDLRAAGLEVKVKRKLYKLTPVESSKTFASRRGQAIGQKVEKHDRSEVVNLSQVASGDLIEVELVVESKNDYEYLLIIDPKAAGFEPVELRSGYNGNELGAYVEYRDASVNLFAKRIARGRHSVTYRLRAETPGKFSALPTQIAAMYAPELRGNSDEVKVRVVDNPVDNPGEN